jgi:hypothetical protein
VTASYAARNSQPEPDVEGYTDVTVSAEHLAIVLEVIGDVTNAYADRGEPFRLTRAAWDAIDTLTADVRDDTGIVVALGPGEPLHLNGTSPW